jgi:hypothetical protein
MPEIMPPSEPNGPNSAGLSPEDIAWAAAGGAAQLERLESENQRLRASQSFGAPGAKYFLVSKGFLGSLWAVLFGLGVTCAEIVGVPAWSLEHWPQLIKVLGAGLGTLAAAYGLYGRVVANAPIKFVLGD